MFPLFAANTAPETELIFENKNKKIKKIFHIIEKSNLHQHRVDLHRIHFEATIQHKAETLLALRNANKCKDDISTHACSGSS
jgi:hypothetical protein